MDDVLGIATGIGAVIAVVLEWFPKLNVWFNSKGERTKRIIVGGLVLSLNSLAVVASCSGVLDAVACPSGDWRGQLVTGVVTGVWALVSSQGAHRLIKRS